MVAGHGHVSPMVHIESYFLDVILQLDVMRQPVTPAIALEIINSMIKDTTIEVQIVEWKKKILPSACESDDKKDNSSTTCLSMKGLKPLCCDTAAVA